MEEENTLQYKFATCPCNCKTIKIHTSCLIIQMLNGFKQCGACRKNFTTIKDGVSCTISQYDINHMMITNLNTNGYIIEELYNYKTLQLIRRTTIQDDKKNGLQECWNITKKGIYYLASQIEYNNNQLHGSYKKYYPNGVVEVDTTYTHNTKNGSFIRRYENNVLMQYTTYINGKLNGEFKSFYPNGTVDIECSYKNNKLHGPYKKLRSDGSVHIIATYHNGIMTHSGALHLELTAFGNIC
jgi:antitoxin component YwqK of YwqJK toxin-antitoxin module